MLRPPAVSQPLNRYRRVLVSDPLDLNEPPGAVLEATTALQNAAQTAAPELAAGNLDELENIDFLLEEIENKIAPLALA